MWQTMLVKFGIEAFDERVSNVSDQCDNESRTREHHVARCQAETVRDPEYPKERLYNIAVAAVRWDGHETNILTAWCLVNSTVQAVLALCKLHRTPSSRT